MNMNKQQIEMAVGAGLELLGEKSEIVVPVKLNDGIFLLKQLLVGIASGGIGLAPTTQAESPTSPPTPPNRKQRRTAKKVGRKKVAKKVSREKK